MEPNCINVVRNHVLIARALEEDRAAIRATTKEASLSHYALAGLMRQKADELLDAELA